MSNTQQDVKDILALNRIVESFTPDEKHGLIAALLDWKHDNGAAPEPTAEPAGAVAQRAARVKRGRPAKVTAPQAAIPPDDDTNF